MSHEATTNWALHDEREARTVASESDDQRRYRFDDSGPMADKSFRIELEFTDKQAVDWLNKLPHRLSVLQFCRAAIQDEIFRRIKAKV